MKRYYYFYTSLKDLFFDLDKSPYILQDFIKDMKDELDDCDFNLLQVFLHRFDNDNLIKALEKKDEFNPLGVFTREEIEEEIKTPLNLPSYMRNFLENLKLDQIEHVQYSLEDQLSIFYYHYLMSQENTFINEYTKFDFNLRNLLAALNCRKYGLDSEKRVLVLNDEASSLISSSSNDFGLSKQFPWLPDVIRFYEESDVLEFEKKIDKLRFEFIDSILTFEYFNISSILGYLIKFLIVERWLKLDSQKGTELFEHITTEMESKIDLLADL